MPCVNIILSHKYVKYDFYENKISLIPIKDDLVTETTSDW